MTIITTLIMKLNTVLITILIRKKYGDSTDKDMIYT